MPVLKARFYFLLYIYISREKVQLLISMLASYIENNRLGNDGFPPILLLPFWQEPFRHLYVLALRKHRHMDILSLWMFWYKDF